MLKLVDGFTYTEKVRALGWMIHHAAGDPKKAAIYKGLVTALHKALPEKITADDLSLLVDSMRGHMRQLAWAGQWLFQDVVLPLLQNGHANTDDACEIWGQELVALLKPELRQQPIQFDLSREGQMTNITAVLFAYSSHERQQTGLQLIKKILNRQNRIIRQPLASTSDWTRWDNALVVSMWVHTFTRWGKHYLRKRGTTNHELEKLSLEARELAMVMPMDEWRLDGPHNKGQLAAFLDQVDELL